VVNQQLDLTLWIDSTRDVLLQWFSVLNKVVAAIELCNIYNIYQMRLRIGILECSQVVIDSSISSTRYKTQPGCKEWLTVIRCVYADRTPVPHIFIFKGKALNENLVNKEISSTRSIVLAKRAGLLTDMALSGSSSALSQLKERKLIRRREC
jgi:hypothetical protein